MSLLWIQYILFVIHYEFFNSYLITKMIINRVKNFNYIYSCQFIGEFHKKILNPIKIKLNFQIYFLTFFHLQQDLIEISI